mmetsp:Transcript_38178/g.61972  ORF Transcript_38178/g.61972 Transcript_38178/m.61972 type:complete len:116 (-) Transcript_38178:25-372(-)
MKFIGSAVLLTLGASSAMVDAAGDGQACIDTMTQCLAGTADCSGLETCYKDTFQCLSKVDGATSAVCDNQPTSIPGGTCPDFNPKTLCQAGFNSGETLAASTVLALLTAAMVGRN